MGLGYALREMVHFKDGRILDSNFSSYDIPRFSWLPQIETHIIADQSADAQGGGEPSIINMGAVIANAVHDATGAGIDRDQIQEAIIKKPGESVWIPPVMGFTFYFPRSTTSAGSDSASRRCSVR